MRNTYGRDGNDKYDLSFQYIFKDYPQWHNHEYWEFPVVLSGELKHSLGEDVSIVGKNTAYLIRPEDYHKWEKKSSKVSMLNILMKDDYVRRICDQFSSELYDNIVSQPTTIQLTLEDKQISELFSNIYSLQERINDEKSYNYISNIIAFFIFGRVTQLTLSTLDNKPQWFSNLLQQAHILRNRKWKVEDLSEFSGYSQGHLCRVFNEYLGCTPKQYLTKVKMSHACNYLAFSDLSVIEIAFELGYTNSSNLNHVFKQHYNISPIQYRKLHRLKQ